MEVKQSDELPGVLWAYRTIVTTSIRETLSKLTYGNETVIPAKVYMVNHRMMKYQGEENEE